MTDILQDNQPEEDPQHNPSENRRVEATDPEPVEDADARDPSRVPPQADTETPTVKPADEQDVERVEVEKGLDWADDDKRSLDRKSHLPE
ncbi:MAG: hypothetical protein LC657_15220 [Desulfobacteraceae bacterium]|nr:hypothetical protein [Desulfobacteraceae bacterium]